MAKSRMSLHEELKCILGSSNVYYQPPETVKLSYPCFVYFKDGNYLMRADNKSYIDFNRYTVVHVGHDPDTDISDRMLKHFIRCRYDRRYTADNLTHDTFDLYY